MCNHEKSKITKRHFNKSGKLVATKVHCLKCGSFETTTTTTEHKYEKYDYESIKHSASHIDPCV